MSTDATPAARVTTVRHGPVAELRMVAPPANTIDMPMLGALIGALDAAAADDDVLAVVLSSGVPGFFCAGLDLKLLNGAPPATVKQLLDDLYGGLYEAQQRLGKPSIAAIDGAARGGGMTLAISCDVLVASASASFGYPEIDLGVLPAIHYSHLPRIAGRHRAFDLLFSGRPFDAAEAQALGLVSGVAPAGQAATEALALAAQIAAKPRSAVQRGRVAFHGEVAPARRQELQRAIDLFCEITATPAAQQGIRAFAERRRRG